MSRSTPGSRSAARSGNAPYCPDAGDFVWLQLNPQVGTEQAGRRPALVLSPREYNQKVRHCIACPTTNRAKGYPFEVAIPNGFAVSGVVLADQIKCLSWEMRGAEFIAVAPGPLVAEVRAKLKALLAIP